MNRRGFLGLLGGAAFALDPERALWVRGARTISIPAPASLNRLLSVDEVMDTIFRSLAIQQANLMDMEAALFIKQQKIGQAINVRRPRDLDGAMRYKSALPLSR